MVIAAGISKTPAHSSVVDGPLFISYDRTMGVKVIHLISELCVCSTEWQHVGKHTWELCRLDYYTGAAAVAASKHTEMTPSHAACLWTDSLIH